VLLMGLNRASKRNAFTVQQLAELAHAYELLETDAELRCGLLYGRGEHFTGGLDLADVTPAVDGVDLPLPSGVRQPWRLDGRIWTKPVVAAVQGWCLTIGVELVLAADITVASADSRFAQLEVQRGILPNCGATIRMPAQLGWGNAMRWLLTGDTFDAAEAHRIGLVQEVVDRGTQFHRAFEIAESISKRSAPLVVTAILAVAQRAVREGEESAVEQQRAEMPTVLDSADAEEGVRSFIEHRDAVFEGK
jgi:enoyl-CoA hydratase/carnithine racemase